MLRIDRLRNWRGVWLDTLRLDLRYARRRLCREPGFTAAAIGTLAVAIGACTAMFSIVQAVLLRSFGVDAPNRIIVMRPTQNGTVGEFSYRASRDIRARMRAFDEVALVSSTTWDGSMAIDGAGEVALSCAVVSGTFFDVLRTRPLLGRAFRPEDDEPDAPPVIVISHGLWTSRFGASPAAIGRTVRVREETPAQSFEIVGVMPAEAFYPRGADYWTPAAPRLARIARQAGERMEPLFEGLGVFYVLGRLHAGTPMEAAQAEAAPFLKALGGDLKVDLTHMGIAYTPLVDHIFGQARSALLILLGAVMLLLLIACTNVAALLLARGVGRGRELAVRASLGADRRTLMRELMTESTLLAVCAAVIGVSAAALTLRALVGLSPSDIPRLNATTLDASVLVFALAVSVATTLGLGVAPAWILSGPSLSDALKGPATGSTGGSGRIGGRQVLVVLQVAGTLVLLIGMGLSIRSFAKLSHLDLGFNPENVLTFSVKGLDDSRYPSPDQRRQAIEQLLSRFERMPRVVAAGALSQRPFENGQVGWDTNVLLEGQVDRPESWSRNPLVNWETVAGDYFRAMGIRLLRGRLFDVADTADALPAVIVSEAMAARVWPGQDPIGKRLRESYFANASRDAAPRWQTVVGVVSTARYRELENPRLDLYVPLRQGGDIHHFTLRTSAPPLDLAPAIGAEIAAFDRGLAIDGVTTMDDVVRRTRGPWQFTMRVFGIFGGIALVLASIGLFSLVTYAVNQRTREIGLRMALGASRADVVHLLLSQGARPAFAGVVLGGIVAAVATGMLSSLLFDTSPTDPATFGCAAALLTIVAGLASYLPARRAASVDPLVVLRDQ